MGPETARTIALDQDGWAVLTLDQTLLPHEERWIRLERWTDVAEAISTMRVRGAPLIGAAAAYGVALAAREDPSDGALDRAAATLLGTRPTAVNLRWALERTRRALGRVPEEEREAAAYHEAAAICEADVAANRSIGEHGGKLLRALAARNPDRPVRVLTHCNAGRLATVAWGTATAPVYLAHAEGLPVHVWVSETRPRSQGLLTAWELARAGVAHTVVTDSACGHLLARGEVDVCLVGTDRTTARGDVANKIGTYPKALAAREAGVPFYVAAPSSSIDWSLASGAAIPIEERDGDEVRVVGGVVDGARRSARILDRATDVANPAFDITPARLITGLITERGVALATRAALADLFPEHADASS
ncbi:MAG: S-methyl-5-thioribose-1-phosphate isomerase [Gemmatimonadota bacterium]